MTAKADIQATRRGRRPLGDRPMTDRQTTHAFGCWGCGPRHYECAVGQIERDEALLRQALEALIWTTGSEDFGEGGLAREGALKLLFPTIDALRERLGEKA